MAGMGEEKHWSPQAAPYVSGGPTEQKKGIFSAMEEFFPVSIVAENPVLFLPILSSFWFNLRIPPGDGLPEAQDVGGPQCPVVEAVARAAFFTPDHPSVVGADISVKAAVC